MPLVSLSNLFTPELKCQLDELPIFWVRTDDELHQLIQEISGLDRVALDTEFIKRTTYFPILALVQVNTGKAIYLVDAPSLDLTNFWQALIKIPKMIWYACGEDLGIFYQLAKCPALTNVIDVQLAVAYLTGELQVGYARAIDECLGVALTKSESQSDWLVRPLSHEQEQYAVDDVRYLFALWDVLKVALQHKGLVDCVLEDSRLYAQDLHNAHTMPDEQLYLDYVAPMYEHHQIAVLQALVAWREKLARTTNRPRTFILNKQPLREIVLTLPCSIKELSRTTINRDSLRLYGDDIVRIIKTTLALSEDKYPPMPRPNYISKDKPYKVGLDRAVCAYSQCTYIPENLLLKSRWVDELLYMTATNGTLTNPALLGYRRTWIEDEILPLLNEHKAFIRRVFGV